MKRKSTGDQTLIIKIMLMVIAAVLVILFKVSQGNILTNALLGVEAEVQTTLYGEGTPGQAAGDVMVEAQRPAVESFTIGLDDVTKVNLATKIASKEETALLTSAMVSSGAVTSTQAQSIDKVFIATGDTSQAKETTISTNYPEGTKIALVSYDSATKSYNYIGSSSANATGTVSYTINGSKGVKVASGTASSITPTSGPVTSVVETLTFPENGTLCLTLIKGHTYKVTALADFNDVTGNTTITTNNDNCIVTGGMYIYANKVGSCEIKGTYKQVNEATLMCKVVESAEKEYEILTKIPGEYVTVKWTNPVATKGVYMGDTLQKINLAKRFRYINEFGDEVCVDPFQANQELHIKKGEALWMEMYFINHSYRCYVGLIGDSQSMYSFNMGSINASGTGLLSKAFYLTRDMKFSLRSESFSSGNWNGHSWNVNANYP